MCCENCVLPKNLGLPQMHFFWFLPQSEKQQWIFQFHYSCVTRTVIESSFIRSDKPFILNRRKSLSCTDSPLVILSGGLLWISFVSFEHSRDGRIIPIWGGGFQLRMNMDSSVHESVKVKTSTRCFVPERKGWPQVRCCMHANEFRRQKPVLAVFSILFMILELKRSFWSRQGRVGGIFWTCFFFMIGRRILWTLETLPIYPLAGKWTPVIELIRAVHWISDWFLSMHHDFEYHQLIRALVTSVCPCIAWTMERGLYSGTHPQRAAFSCVHSGKHNIFDNSEKVGSEKGRSSHQFAKGVRHCQEWVAHRQCLCAVQMGWIHCFKSTRTVSTMKRRSSRKTTTKTKEFPKLTSCLCRIAST